MKFCILSLLALNAVAFSPAPRMAGNQQSTALNVSSRREILASIPVAALLIPASALAKVETPTIEEETKKSKKSRRRNSPKNEAVAEVTKEEKRTSKKSKDVAKASEKDEKKNAKKSTVVALNYQGVFADPKHPRGYRIIIAGKKGATMKLQDTPEGKIYNIPIKVTNDKKKGTELTIDFSPKGGPKNIVGTVLPSGNIAFTDGNTWKKAKGLQGLYADPQYPNGYRVIRQAAGSKGIVVELKDNQKGNLVSVPAKQSGKSLVLDFSSKGGPEQLKGVIANGSISFPDGNKWTKL